MGQCGAGDQVWPFDAGRILFKSLLCQEMFVWPYWSDFSKIPFSHVKIHCRWLFFGVLWGYYEVNCARGSVCCPCNEKHYQTSVSFPFYFGESESQNLEKKPQSQLIQTLKGLNPLTVTLSVYTNPFLGYVLHFMTTLSFSLSFLFSLSFDSFLRFALIYS